MAREADVVADAETAVMATGVPAGLLLVVGVLESHLGCDPASGGSWGAPIDPQHRRTAGTPTHTARALATSFRVCGSWVGALHRFRCGLCVCRRPLVGYTPAQALSLAERMYASAGQDLPLSWRKP